MHSPANIPNITGATGEIRKLRAGWVLALLTLYTLIFGPSVFARIEASEFMGIDPSSIMDALDGLTTGPVYYDMNKQYHSQFYGWTYFALNAVIIAAMKALGFGSELAINLAARIILFIIGSLLVWKLLVLARMFFPAAWAAAATLVFIVNPVSAHYFVEIHPETLGLLCQVLALQKLVELYRAPRFDSRMFITAVIFLSLSALSKHFFFVVAFFIYVAFFVAYARRSRDAGDPASITWGRALRLTAQGVTVFLVVTFVVHPYALLDPLRFWTAQTGLASDHSSRELGEALRSWLGVIGSNPLVSMNLLLLLAIPFLGSRFHTFKLSIFLTAGTMGLFMFASRTWISSNYFYPLHGFAVFNLFFFLVHVLLPALQVKLGSKPARIVAGTFAVCIAFVTAWNLAFTTSRTHERFLLDGLTTHYAAWSWVSSELPLESRIAYSPNVALLEPLKSQGCHPWQTCPNLATLETFEPDHLLFSPDYPHFDSDAFGSLADRYGFTLKRSFAAEPIMTRSGCTPFSFQRVLRAFSSPLACIETYRQAWAARAEGRIVEGLEVVLYSRNR